MIKQQFDLKNQQNMTDIKQQRNYIKFVKRVIMNALIISYDIFIMLHSLCRSLINTTPKSLVCRQLLTITATKSLNDKKKKIYENQSLDKKTGFNNKRMTPQQERNRLEFMQQQFFQMGKQMFTLFNHTMTADRKKAEITTTIARQQTKILKECENLSALELINYYEITKNMALVRLEHLEHVQIAYQELQQIATKQNHPKIIKQHFDNLWNEKETFQTQIRSVCLMQFLDEQRRSIYLRKVIPLIKYFKTTGILILMYEKWHFNFSYPYELMDQIHLNQIFISMEDINQSYYKMLFTNSNRGEFVPNQDGIFSKILTSFLDKPNVLALTAFNKFVKILHSQSFYVQTDSTRYQLEYSLNGFINIAKNQNYQNSIMNLSQLVQIYLGFEESNSTGQILLNQIIYVSKTSNFKITNENFSLYEKLLKSILKNIQKRLKYERRDFLNKEYTNDTINFLNQFIPKYLDIWPQVIFQLNDACQELFPKSNKNKNLLNRFQATFQQIITKKNGEINLENRNFTLKVLKFLVIYKKMGDFNINQDKLIEILGSFDKNIKNKSIQDQQLQILYLILSLLQNQTTSSKFKKIFQKINSDLIQAQMNKQIQIYHEDSLIMSLDHKIVWLSLCGAKLRYYGFPIDESIVQIFVNQKLLFMINSLKYKEVYQILVYTIGLSRLSPQIYERLLYNLSTFIIYIDQKNTKVITSSYYLNHHFTDLYIPICRLVLQNKHIFKTVKEKDAFKVIQIMMYKNISHFSNSDIITFLQILGNPSFLSISMSRYIQDIKFTIGQLEGYQHSTPLRSFQYYNKSLLRFFEGKYNESDVKSKLKEDSLTKHEIQQYFSKLEVYKTIIMDGELNIRFDLPEPKTSIPDFKCMYACLKIYQKIRLFKRYDFQEGEYSFKIDKGIKIDLTAEKNYINRQLLLPGEKNNEFRIQQRALPKYIKLQVWKTFVFFQKQLMVEPKDLFLNSKKLTDQILNKIIRGVCGSFQKIREVVKEFSSHEDLINKLSELKVPFEQHGSALEFGTDSDEKKLTILTSNNANYKIIYICAFFIQNQGRKVIVLKENQKIEPVVNFLQLHFSPKASEPQNEKEDEQQNELGQ